MEQLIKMIAKMSNFHMEEDMTNKLVISEEGVGGIERLILTINIGLLTLLEEKALSIEEAENYIYSPYSESYLKRLDVNPQILDLIISGCQLEDFESLLPHKLFDKIHVMKTESINIYKTLKRPLIPTKKWIDMQDQ